MSRLQIVRTFRPGVMVVEQSQSSDGTQYIYRFKATSSGPYLIPGRTILLHDSFFERTMDLLSSYFEGITFISEHIHQQPETIDLIANSDTFIMALVERTLMGTGWYHQPDYQSEIESAIHQGVALRH